MAVAVEYSQTILQVLAVLVEMVAVAVAVLAVQ